MKNELLELNMDYAILWGSNEFDLKETEIKEENDEYVLIDNPINRIKNVKY